MAVLGALEWQPIPVTAFVPRGPHAHLLVVSALAHVAVLLDHEHAAVRGERDENLRNVLGVPHSRGQLVDHRATHLRGGRALRTDVEQRLATTR